MGFWQLLKLAILWPFEGSMRGKATPKSLVRVRIFRADGTVEDLGVVSRNGKPTKRVS